MMKALVLNYTHPEGYPPTFNAINNLSKHFEQVYVLSTDTLETKWSYDENVDLILIDSEKDRFKDVTKSKWQKLKAYLTYFNKLRKLLKQEKPDLLLIYDGVPLFIYYLVSKTLFGKTPLVWYHNHDIFPLSFYKKYSINWFGALIEQKRLNIAHIFSLPANERKEFFPLESYKGEYLFIPNYPSNYFHGQLRLEERKIEDRINIIYPGSICEKHGFEELISILNEKVAGKEIHLTLLGDLPEAYGKTLMNIAKEHGTSANLHFLPRVSYFDVPEIMKTQHIGWAVNKPLDVTYATGGTAANKIYEFLSLGMPILLFDNEHYRKYLEENDWAKFTNLSKDSLCQQIGHILNRYSELSKQARASFEKNYSFELAFEEAIERVKTKLK